ncbi:hypothetical protein EVAR_101362_1 [Eumeta japonica]|uniref:Uncharacterized protein n=1 Tax=Eumeta variegata TaxID=151549 RepID=A0A4C1SJP0_EUMVA|nr:hypothetical protein EVAR_101362_1 [Eumeta japonica]
MGRHIAHGPIIAGQEKVLERQPRMDVVKWVDRPLGGPTDRAAYRSPLLVVAQAASAGMCWGYRRVRPTLQRNNDRDDAFPMFKYTPPR